MAAVGIDIGINTCCVGIFRDGKVEIVANERGNRQSESFVSFTPNNGKISRLVASLAKEQVTVHPESTIYNIKRLIGRTYKDTGLVDDTKQWTFELINDTGRPKYFINEAKSYFPEEITAMMFGMMKEMTEHFTGLPLKEVVITVPTNFNDSQREATKDAAELAGLQILQVMNDTTAVALAYGFDNMKESARNVLIYDLGGGSFDVSLLRLDGRDFRVKASAGNSRLGGEDFDDRLVNYCIKIFLRHHNQDVSNSKTVVWRLRLACERAKRTLSYKLQTNIHLKNLFCGIDFKVTITRGKFEEICSDLFQATIGYVIQVLKAAKIRKYEVQEVVLVGGSTKIPKIESMLSEFFNKKDLCKSMHPCEAVAYGAAIQAAILKGDSSDILRGIHVTDVGSFTLGMETPGGVMTQFIQMNSPIPFQSKQILSSQNDDKSSVSIRLFEGERDLVRDNNVLGNFQLSDLQPVTRQLPQREVTFLVDANGILSVTTPNWVTGKPEGIEINKDRLNKYDKMQLKQNMHNYTTDDEEQKRAIVLRQIIEKYIYYTKATMTQDRVKTTLTFCQHFEITEACNELLQWLDDHPSATAEQLERELVDIKLACVPVMI